MWFARIAVAAATGLSSSINRLVDQRAAIAKLEATIPILSQKVETTGRMHRAERGLHRARHVASDLRACCDDGLSQMV
jgi:hypothetical protein